VDPFNVLTRGAEGPDAVIRYADRQDAVIDVFLPPSLGRPAAVSPVVFFVHGGFWREEWDRMHARPLANALAQRGFVVAVPEYRRVGGGGGGGGGWPTTADDVEQALQLVPHALAEIAPGHTDKAQSVSLAGHSAGGHLALWAGLRAGRSRVSRVVALAPVADIRWAANAGMGGGAVQALLGGEPDERPTEYAEADVVPLLDGRIPVTIVQGSVDDVVDATMNRELAGRVTSLDYIELEGVDHFALVDPLEPAFTDVLVPLLATS
jgi:acetyl esterase/lipase